jgi:phage-related protein
MNPDNSNIKHLIWLADEIKTPPFYRSVRIEVGFLLQQLLNGELPTLPMSKPMSSIGDFCHELRVNDLNNNKNWRVIYRIDDDAIIILEVFAKTTKKTPDNIIDRCQKRLRSYDPQNLAAHGWNIGSITQFLKLSPEEIMTIEIRLSLSKYLERLKQEQLAKNPSTNPRIPKVESVDPSVSIDLLIRMLVEIGATREGIAMAISGN